MKFIKQADVLAGSHIAEIAEEAIQYINSHSDTGKIVFDFNGVHIEVYGFSTVGEIVKKYEKRLENARYHEE